MKLDVLSKEDLINIVRERVPNLQEEKLVHQVLESKANTLYEEYQRACERKEKAEAWCKAFLENYEYRERTPGRKEYFVPRGDLKEHEKEIKELNEARAGWWATEQAHSEAFQKSWDAFRDAYVPEFESSVVLFKEKLAEFDRRYKE